MTQTARERFLALHEQLAAEDLREQLAAEERAAIEEARDYFGGPEIAAVLETVARFQSMSAPGSNFDKVMTAIGQIFASARQATVPVPTPPMMNRPLPLPNSTVTG